jgi:glycosyltransferase involved in cell wall biosynthesis
MKIVHLSTSATGGAAVVANSLSRIQRSFGHESSVVKRDDNLPFVAKIKSKVSTFISLANATSEYAQVTHFSSSGINLKKIWDLNPEVIFVHNWFNFLDNEQIISITNRIPTIFVAHDARLATGGCHVTLGCRNFNSSCSPCPASHIDKFASIAKESIDSMVEQLDRYAVVTPSTWLMNEISKSPIIQRASVKATIGNPTTVEPEFEKPHRFQDVKRFRILFVAATFDSKYKGFDLLLEALSRIEKKEIVGLEIDLRIVGAGASKNHPPTDSGIRITFLGELKAFEVHQLMRDSDLLVVPSLSENYPGVIAEAQLIGCTVAASRVGGIPEMIEDGVSGFLFEPNSLACKTAIIRAINCTNRTQITNSAREIASLRHDENKINREYEAVIEELLRS